MTNGTTTEGGGAYCARFHYAIELIGRRWTGAILIALRSGRSRYGEIRDSVPGLSDRMLCDRLRELEATGLVERHVTPATPVQVRYQLTAKGEGLAPVLDELSRWANHWLDPEPAPASWPTLHEAGGARVSTASKERR